MGIGDAILDLSFTTPSQQAAVKPWVLLSFRILVVSWWYVQWIFQVPIKGGRWHIIPPIGSIYHLYTTCILPSGGLYATYHLLREPETTIDWWYVAVS